MNNTTIMQGDQYAVPLIITNSKGTVITDEDVTNVEIVLGDLRKTMPEISYNAENGRWEFPLTQQESFSFNANMTQAQVRVMFKNGDVVGVELDRICILRSVSREVL